MYPYTKHLSCFSRHISTMTYSQMKRSRLRRDEDSVPANTRSKGPRSVCPMQRTWWDWNYSDRRSQGERASIIFVFPLRSNPLLPSLHDALLLSFFPSDVLHPPPPISSSPPPSLGRTDLLSRLVSSLSSDRERERERGKRSRRIRGRGTKKW